MLQREGQVGIRKVELLLFASVIMITAMAISVWYLASAMAVFLWSGEVEPDRLKSWSMRTPFRYLRVYNAGCVEVYDANREGYDHDYGRIFPERSLFVGDYVVPFGAQFTK